MRYYSPSEDHIELLLSLSQGVHPHDAKSWEEEGDVSTLSTLREFAMNPECVAIGECGLDFNRNFSPPETQLEVFEKQVRLRRYSCLLS